VPSVSVLVAKDHSKDRARKAQLAADARKVGEEEEAMLPARASAQAYPQGSA
jgi:hypothetical protein